MHSPSVKKKLRYVNLAIASLARIGVLSQVQSSTVLVVSRMAFLQLRYHVDHDNAIA